jgi:hypothetical protein
MTEAEKLAEFVKRLEQTKSPNATSDRLYVRGWNQAMDRAIEKAKALFGEESPGGRR